MKIANENICPNCAELIPTTVDLIHPCEYNPRSEYSIVYDGAEFGIAFEQVIKTHGLSFENAERMLALLKWNQNQQNQDYDWLGPL